MATPAGIFKVSRPSSHYIDYDEYSSFVVVCRDAFVARRTHPRATADLVAGGYGSRWCATKEAWVDCDNEYDTYHGWTSYINELEIERIGDADPKQKLGVVCASFRAG